MRVSLIVAVDRRLLIGNETGLPWHLPADLRRFRKLTIGKPIIMGRKTHEHIGSPLKDRINIILTRNADYNAPGCVIVHSIEEAFPIARAFILESGSDEIMVIGGAEVFQQAFPFIERIYLTVVEGEFSGNSYFPSMGQRFWQAIQEETIPADEKNKHRHRFMILDRTDVGRSFEEWVGASDARV